MGTDTIQTAIDGTVVPADHHNSIKGALSQDFLPRNTSGVVADEAGDLGSSTYSWKDLYVKSLNILPPGMMVPYAGSTAPSKWLLTDGDTIGNVGSGADHESADYETLFELLKTSWGNAGTEVWASGHTVLLPDTRGRFIRSWDNGAGIDSGRSIGTTQTGEFEQHDHYYEVTGKINVTGSSPRYLDETPYEAWTEPANFLGNDGTGADVTFKRGTKVTAGTAAETRPTNLSANYIIKI